jgi:predicted phosphodiesterase
VSIGVVSDVHANLVALEAVLEDMGAVDALWVCGDTVGYGPDPSDVLALVRVRGAALVGGNHDRAVATGEDLELFNEPAAIAATLHQEWLSAAERDVLGALPPTLEASDVTLCHGSLRDPYWEYVTNATAAAASLARATTSHCCAGHTHVPALFSANGARIGHVRYGEPYPLGAHAFFNPGSVGQPRDGDRRAAYAIVDPVAATVTFHRVEYRIEVTQRRMAALGLPAILADRLAFGL